MYKFCTSLVFVFTSAILLCSEEIYKYEDMVLQELKANKQSMSKKEIKKWANFISKWSEPDFYRKEIEAFKKSDSKNFPKKKTILFIGSSTIVFWKNLEKDMFPYEILNRGFGGAHINHVNNHFDEIVAPYKPRGIVFFCGTNDLAALKSPQQVFDNFLSFYKKVNNSLPKTKVFVIGIKPTIARDHLKEKELNLNSLTANLAKQEDNLIYINVWDDMLLKNGKADPSLFVQDGLHLNEDGYEIWNNLVKPHLKSNFKPDKT